MAARIFFPYIKFSNYDIIERLLLFVIKLRRIPSNTEKGIFEIH